MGNRDVRGAGFLKFTTMAPQFLDINEFMQMALFCISIDLICNTILSNWPLLGKHSIIILFNGNEPTLFFWAFQCHCHGISCLTQEIPVELESLVSLWQTHHDIRSGGKESELSFKTIGNKCKRSLPQRNSSLHKSFDPWCMEQRKTWGGNWRGKFCTVSFKAHWAHRAWSSFS